jgi:hypothetical protein
LIALKDAQKLTFEHVIKADDIFRATLLKSRKESVMMFYKLMVMQQQILSFMLLIAPSIFLTAALTFMPSQILIRLCQPRVILK